MERPAAEPGMVEVIIEGILPMVDARSSGTSLKFVSPAK